MNYEAVRSLAETGQAASHALRTMHRTAQKEAEVEEQWFRNLMREIDKRVSADRGIDALLENAPASCLAKIAGALPPSVAPATPFTPALDYRETQPAEPPKSEPNVCAIPVSPRVIEALTKPPRPVARPAKPVVLPPKDVPKPSRPNGPAVRALGDEILGLFQKVRLGDIAAIETEELHRATGKSPSAVSVALSDLAERGLIRRVKEAERGHVTVLIKDEVAA